MQLHLRDVADTDALGRALAATQPEHAVVYLHGDLGAGKSTIARAWLRALGIAGAIRSPTYTLVEQYPLALGGLAIHLDLYRVAAAAELEFLALDDADARLWLVEWPERGAGGLPEADLSIDLEWAGEGRDALLTGGSASGRAWLTRLTGMAACEPFLHGDHRNTLQPSDN
ncbi:MAG: hypothetical protein JWL98_104 [Xanthomonadaceae bacterium]|nr:hypothetical protein [Xanthomonadaceae bacterium]